MVLLRLLTSQNLHKKIGQIYISKKKFHAIMWEHTEISTRWHNSPRIKTTNTHHGNKPLHVQIPVALAAYMLGITNVCHKSQAFAKIDQTANTKIISFCFPLYRKWGLQFSESHVSCQHRFCLSGFYASEIHALAPAQVLKDWSFFYNHPWMHSNIFQDNPLFWVCM